MRYPVTTEVLECLRDGRWVARRHFGGQVWRHELEPVDGGTTVNEIVDGRTAGVSPVFELIGVERPRANARLITPALASPTVQPAGPRPLPSRPAVTARPAISSTCATSIVSGTVRAARIVRASALEGFAAIPLRRRPSAFLPGGPEIPGRLASAA